VGTLIALALRVLRRTWRVVVLGVPPAPGTLVAFWHGDQIALTATGRLLPGLSVLVSRSRDGAMAAAAAARIGYGLLRGSTSRGAVSAGLGVVHRLRAGGSVAVAVDGPRGPRHQTGDSLSRLARIAGAPLVPMAASSRRGIRLASWDRLGLPARFARLSVVFGDRVEEGASLQAALDDVHRRACALADAAGPAAHAATNLDAEGGPR
jgi:lysophospholipid acyltransferase (LPLAT)-like uncharacterized protein